VPPTPLFKFCWKGHRGDENNFVEKVIEETTIIKGEI
jgi:hypothetical protein